MWKPSFPKLPGWRIGFIVGLLVLTYGAVAVLAHAFNSPLNTFSVWLILTTLVAALGGIFRDVIMGWVEFPELDMLYVHTHPYCDDPPFRKPDTNEFVCASYFFRPAVINKGTRRAENVEVIAYDLHQLGDNSRELIRRYSMNLGWSNAGTTVLDGLSPGVDRYFDLGKVLDPGNRHKMHGEQLPYVVGILFSIEMQVKGTHLPHLLEPGKYELTLAVVASNCKLKRFIATIDIIGDWENKLEDILEDGIKIDIRPA